MIFGQLVIGAPGAGKSTYCAGMAQFMTALKRRVVVVNLDPANDDRQDANPTTSTGSARQGSARLPYECALSISELITVKEAMETTGLGPNGAILYCMEMLESHMDWFMKRLRQVTHASVSVDTDGGDTTDEQDTDDEDAYVIFDVAGQVELSTNHQSLKNILDRLTKSEYRLVAVQLMDAHHITDTSKYISATLLSLRAMLQLELPHVNVLSKIDLLANFKDDLAFNLDFYTEVQDLRYLIEREEASSRLTKKYQKLNAAICEIIEDFSLVGFETLCVDDKLSMLRLVKILDKAIGYAEVDRSQVPEGEEDVLGVSTAMLASAVDWSDIGQVQERWIDAREDYDAFERRAWAEEGISSAIKQKLQKGSSQASSAEEELLATEI